MQVDALPYRTFKKLKEKFPIKTLVLDDAALSIQGTHLLFKDHREWITHLFKKEGVEVTRFGHDYTSLDTSHPQLGLVFLANDSVIVPAMEVHALIGHNAKYILKAVEAKDGI